MVGSAAVLALVWLTASFVATRGRDPAHVWSSDPGQLEEKIAATLTVFNLSDDSEPQGQGSGFVIAPDGVGVTNVHVLRGATRAYVELGDGRAYDIMKVLAWDPRKDLVVFQLGRDFGEGPEWPSGLARLKLSPSRPLKVGDWVATLTSPKGLNSTLTDGLVSAYRDEDGMRYLQTTAPISPGSSGGPLFDRRGDVVGVAVSQFSEGQNLNFAVPVDSLRPLVERNEDLSFADFQGQLFALDWVNTGLDREAASGAQACMSAYEEGEYAAALRGFLALARLRPRAPYPYLMAARCCRGMDEEARAVPFYRLYLERAYPEDPVRPQVEDWLRQRGYAPAGD